MRLVFLSVLLVIGLAGPVAAVAAEAVTPTQCGAGDAGAPCGGDGPATLGNQSGTNQGAGNPIHLITGNKYQVETDLPALPGVLGLEIVRHYNSVHAGPNAANGILGRGWRLSYETDLYAVHNTLQISQADGSRIVFIRNPKNPSLCASNNPANGRLAIQRGARGDEYLWTWPNGRTLRFNSQGKLIQIKAPSGEFVHLTRDPAGVLVKVTDPQGRSLILGYPATRERSRFNGVTHIDSPVGRFGYHYGSAAKTDANNRALIANLVRVDLPGHSSRHYHYEDGQHPTLLTGISVSGQGGKAQRLSSWAYDERGRAILSVKGWPRRIGPDGKPVPGTGIEQVNLDFKKIPATTSEAGQTVLTNSLGQQTTYKHAIIGNEYRLLEVKGPGCASCGETDVKYGYDPLGRLTATTQLGPQGTPLETVQRTFDADGRTIQVSRIAYVNGKPGKAQLQVRYEYAKTQPDQKTPAFLNPILIARPSVIAGREAITRMTYNPAGQPIEVTETGFAPALADQAPSGFKPVGSALTNAPHQAKPTKLKRTTRYRYRTLNGRSVLSEIDGPLPNGPSNSPSDSDVTRIEWDGRGNFITAIIEPGGFESEVRYDEVGRVGKVADVYGLRTTFNYDSGNRVTRIATHTAGSKVSVENIAYDALGNQVEIGSGTGKNYRGQVKYGYDAAGRKVWVAQHLGIVEHYRFDTESRLLEETKQSANFKQTHTYQYDALGRLVATTDPSGGIRRIGYNVEGLPDVLIDALGREERYRYDARGNLAQVVQAANSAQAKIQNTTIRFEHDAHGQVRTVIAPNGAKTRYSKDDFGRTRAIFSPDRGVIQRSYDAADRLIAAVDANGNRASYEYDAVGRISKQTITDANPTNRVKPRIITTWRYQGKRLVAVEHPNQREHYRYDSDGRVIAKTITLKLANGAQTTSLTHYRYDALGQLASVSLPDGSALSYRRNGQNQLVSLTRSRIHTPWLAWMLPEQMLIKDIERDIVGLKSYTYGNGIEAQFQRSREGALARVVYLGPPSKPADTRRTALIERILGIRAAGAAEPTQSPSASQPGLPGALGLPAEPRALIDHRLLWDAAGNLLHIRNKDGTNDYAYDAQDRLIVAAATKLPQTLQVKNQPSSPIGAKDSALTLSRYFFDGAGNRLLAQEGVVSQADAATHTIKTAYHSGSNRALGGSAAGVPPTRYDANGQPVRIGNREYVWDALGKLTELREHTAHDPKTLARYRYNHRGERISKTAGMNQLNYLYDNRRLMAELDHKGRIARQYVYLGGQPIAVIDAPKGAKLPGEDEPMWRRIMADLATVFRAWFAKSESIAYLHSNHLGAIERATNQNAASIWRAEYSPFGKLVQTAGSRNAAAGFALNLRLPGQYEDSETGLYYNDHRYYDPETGRYLSPDPLGIRGGINSYAYAGNNPLKYIDPTGLILFAFDGTGNSDNPAPDDLSNVYKFYRDLYNDGERFYITGVGTKDPVSGIGHPYPSADMAQALTGKERIAHMIKEFQGYAKTAQEEVINIDVIGFSRGAAQGRDFVNQLVANTKNGWYSFKDAKGAQNCKKVNYRFMGLWDTVLSTHTGSYNLAIPDSVKYVAHAVAVNEHRTLFPGESIYTSPAAAASSTGVRNELGFVGAHSDIGGGYAEGDLSDVALSWMYQQAKFAGVKLDPLADKYQTIKSPIWHDSNTQLIGSGFDDSGDRKFKYQGGTWFNQKVAPVPGMTFTGSQPFLKQYPTAQTDAHGNKILRGTIDMKGYSAWLKTSYGLNIAY